MTARAKYTEFEVIPVGNLSFFKADENHTDITISVPDVQENQMELYYLLKRPAFIDEGAFKVALEAAFRTVAELSSSAATGRSVYPGKAGKGKKTAASGSTNTRRLEQLKEMILNDSEWLPAQEVSCRAGSGTEVKNPSGLPNRWKRARKIFAISSEGKDLYPDYALDEGGQPLPLIKKIIALFGETKTPWSLAFWFGTPNSWLGNKKPKDLLISAPEKVWEAALTAKDGPVHG